MRILLISTSYNCLTQRAHLELSALGHEVSVELSLNDEAMRETVAWFEPELIICPYLKEKIHEDIFRNHTCIVIHPGIKGDRGPSSLDWAIIHQEEIKIRPAVTPSRLARHRSAASCCPAIYTGSAAERPSGYDREPAQM